jgi:O-methyltransferase involved in polyketide biosynthesis
MDCVLQALTPAQESLFLTLHLRALDSRAASPILGDTVSSELADRVDYDFTRLKVQRSMVLDLAVRTKTLDELIRRFVSRHGNAVVLDLGCGLDPRMLRCGPPGSVDWYDIDFPLVTELRERLLPGDSHLIAADLTTPAWLESIPARRPTMIVADGLMSFMTGDAYQDMTRRLTTWLPNGEFAFNAYTALDMAVANHTATFKALGLRAVGEGFTDPHEPESWGAGLTLIEELLLARAPEVAKFPEPLRSFTRLCAHSTGLSRHGNRVVRYAF